MSDVEQLKQELNDVRAKKNEVSKKRANQLAKYDKMIADMNEKLKIIRAKRSKAKREMLNKSKVAQRKAENHRKYTYGGLIVKYAEWIDEEALEELLIKHHEEFQQAKKSLPFVMTIGKDKTE